MASVVTNKGKFRWLEIVFRNDAEPTVNYVALVTSAVAPVADTNTKSELTEVPNGQGYTTGGITVASHIVGPQIEGGCDADPAGHARQLEPAAGLMRGEHEVDREASPHQLPHHVRAPVHQRPIRFRRLEEDLELAHGDGPYVRPLR